MVVKSKSVTIKWEIDPHNSCDLIARIHCGYSLAEENLERLNRIALTMSQIREYDPPPNPAKLTDSRSNKYVNEYGDESWELDALEPTVLTGLIRDAVFELRDEEIWDSSVRVEDNAKTQLKGVAKNWEKVVKAIK